MSKPRSTEDSLSGAMLADRYLLEEHIGQGGMGAIYRANHLPLARTVCVKLLHPHAASDDFLVQRFQREARVLSEIQHPNIVTILDFGIGDIASDDQTPIRQDTLFLVMELVDGLTLGQILSAKQRFSMKGTAALLAQVCHALDEAHAHGVVHRDLKPENIMVYSTRQGDTVAKVLDFGIAKILDSPRNQEKKLTTAGCVFGTPEYMSPEQARGGEVDARADLYALGALMFQMLTGRLPFSCESPVELVTMHLTEPPPAPSLFVDGLPEPLEALVLELLEKKPDDRPPSALAVRDRLKEIQETLQDLPAKLKGEPETKDEDALFEASTCEAMGDGEAHTMLSQPTRDTSPIRLAPGMDNDLHEHSISTEIRVRRSRQKKVAGLAWVALVLLGGAIGIQAQPTGYLPIPEMPPTHQFPQVNHESLDLRAEVSSTPISHKHRPDPIVRSVALPVAKTATPLPAPVRKTRPTVRKPASSLKSAENKPRTQREIAPPQNKQSFQVEAQGDAMVRTQNHERAATFYKKAYKLSNRTRILKKLGRSLLLSGNPKQAKHYLSLYLESLKGDERTQEELKINLWFDL